MTPPPHQHLPQEHGHKVKRLQADLHNDLLLWQKQNKTQQIVCFAMIFGPVRTQTIFPFAKATNHCAGQLTSDESASRRPEAVESVSSEVTYANENVTSTTSNLQEPSNTETPLEDRPSTINQDYDYDVRLLFLYLKAFLCHRHTSPPLLTALQTFMNQPSDVRCYLNPPTASKANSPAVTLWIALILCALVLLCLVIAVAYYGCIKGSECWRSYSLEYFRDDQWWDLFVCVGVKRPILICVCV